MFSYMASAPEFEPDDLETILGFLPDKLLSAEINLVGGFDYSGIKAEVDAICPGFVLQPHTISFMVASPTKEQILAIYKHAHLEENAKRGLNEVRKPWIDLRKVDWYTDDYSIVLTKYEIKIVYHNEPPGFVKDIIDAIKNRKISELGAGMVSITYNKARR